MLRTLPLAALLVLALAAPASAARPFFLGTGGDPGIAVDAAGTAHVAWWVESADGAAPDAVHYCQVPRRARRCAAKLVLPVAGPPSLPTRDVQVLLPRPGAVQVLAPRVNDPGVMFSSADGGATFAATPLPELQNVAEALRNPDGTLSLLGDSHGHYVQLGGDGSGPPGWAVEFGDAAETLDQTLVLHRGRPVVLLAGTGGFKTFAWTGAGSPNDQASWAPGPGMPYGAWEPSAASGRSGTFVAFLRREGGRKGTFVRRLTPARFGRARRITREDFTSPELVQWPNGRLTVLYEQGDALRYRHSRRGRRWSAPRRLFTGHEPGGLRAVAGRRGGWAVWDGDRTPSSGEPIRLVRLPRP